MNWALTRVLGMIGKKFDGYKTKTGGIGLILMGIIGLINLIFPDTVPGVNLTVEEVIGCFSVGFVTLGIGGKLDKNTEAVKGAQSGTTSTIQPEAQTITTPELSDEQRSTLNHP